jgi:hypothetical protein
LSPNDLYVELDDALLEVAWQQWTAIGLAGIRASRDTLVDPEALTLATFEIAQTDPRLFDEVFDWLSRNHAVVDVSRLRRMAKAGTGDQRRLLGVAARVAGLHGASPTLTRLPDEEFIARESHAGYGERALFTTESGRPLPPSAHGDPLFASAGYLRGPLELRGMSRAPDASIPAGLRFRARALVGIGPRAEVLTYLWTHEWAHGREIAARTAYGQTPVADYLASLADWGWTERRIDGRRTLYRLTRPLREAVSTPPRYVDWVTAWPALVGVLESLRPTDMSEDARWMRLYQALAQHEPGLRAEGLEVELGDLRSWVKRGPDVLQRAVVAVADAARAAVG